MRYNHSHDQLLLTGSSDSSVILSNMVSISSEPFGHLVDDDELSDNEESQQEDKYTFSPSTSAFFVSSDFLYKCNEIYLFSSVESHSGKFSSGQFSLAKCFSVQFGSVKFQFS